MRKLYIGIIAAVVALGIFTGCNGKNNSTGTAGGGVNNPDNKTEYIGEDAAKKIALDKAGLKENEVEFVKVHLEKDDGLYIYDVEFHKDRVEYSAEIKADDGKILDWDKDLDD